MPHWERHLKSALLACCVGVLSIGADAAQASPLAQVAGCARGTWHVVEFNSSVAQVQSVAESITSGDVYLAVLDEGPFEMLWDDLTVTRMIGPVTGSVIISGSSSGTLTEIAPGLVSGVTDRTVMRTTVKVGDQPPVEQVADDIGPRDDAPPATYECRGGQLETMVGIPGGGVVRLVFEPLP